MKKTILLLTAAVALGASLSAQVFGVKAGVNMASMSGYENTQMEPLITAAGIAEFEISYGVNFTLEAGLTQRGGSYDSVTSYDILGIENSTTSSITTTFNQIVVSPGVAFLVSREFSIGLAPYVGYASTQTVTSNTDQIDIAPLPVVSGSTQDFHEDNKLDYGVNLNLNYVIRDALLLSGGYSYGLKDYALLEGADRSSNNGIMFSVGYYFNRY